MDGVETIFTTRPTAHGAVAQSPGWFIAAQDPERDPSRAGAVETYPISVQCQGRAWAESVQLVAALEDIERGLGIDVQPVDRIPGRCDLCADVWICDNYEGRQPSHPTACDLYLCLVCDGSIRRVDDNWCSNTKRRQLDSGSDFDPRFVGGSGGAPITMYLGSRCGLQLCVYVKSVEFAENTRDQLEPAWRASGWDPSDGLVARIEYRVSREFIRRQSWGGRLGKTLSLSDLHAMIPDLWRECLRRIRWAPGEGRKRDRVWPPLWKMLSYVPPLQVEGAPIALHFAARDYDRDLLFRRTKHSLIAIDEAFGRAALDDVLTAAIADTTENIEYRAKTPWRGFAERKKRHDEEWAEKTERAAREREDTKAREGRDFADGLDPADGARAGEFFDRCAAEERSGDGDDGDDGTTY